jgi:ABC-type lipoprotein release transport system permease subunit
VTSIGQPDLREIVGVVADVKQKSVQETRRMTIYLPDSQNAVRYTTIIIRAGSGDPMRLERSIRHALFEEAPELTLAPMRTLDRGNEYLTRAPLRAMWLIGIFAEIALALASIGVHGVVSYATSQRSREMGIRMALGARPADLFSLVTKQAVRLALIGAGIGIVAAYGSTKLLTSLLFGVGRTDPETYATASVILSATAVLASLRPAVRAARTDPSITLRSE